MQVCTLVRVVAKLAEHHHIVILSPFILEYSYYGIDIVNSPGVRWDR